LIRTTIEALERRIGLRRNATRAPTQAPEWRGGFGRPYIKGATVKRKLLLVLVLLTLPSLIFGSEHQWHWVKAGNNVTGWDVATGNADVVINGGTITATLFWSDSEKDIQITLKGSITGDKLTVKETVHNSDYSGSTYTGTRTVKKWPEVSGTIGVETITLSDGLGMIGISRSLKK
jgi:hypothetical protein